MEVSMSLEHELDAEKQVDSHENTVAQPQEQQNGQPTPTNTGSTCASQIASEMELTAFAARNSGDTKLAELLENWHRRLRTA